MAVNPNTGIDSTAYDDYKLSYPPKWDDNCEECVKEGCTYHPMDCDGPFDEDHPDMEDLVAEAEARMEDR